LLAVFLFNNSSAYGLFSLCLSFVLFQPLK